MFREHSIKINLALLTMKADGSYEALYMKWFDAAPPAEFMKAVGEEDTTGS